MEPEGTGSGRRDEDTGADWPYGTLLFFGFFGTDTPEGRRLAWRSSALLVVFVVCALGVRGGYDAFFPDALWVAGMPGSVVGLWWAYARYLGALDELSRAIQLRAFAAAYGAAMTLLAVGLTAAWVDPAPAAPEYLVLFPVFAEGFRGLTLAMLARKYR